MDTKNPLSTRLSRFSALKHRNYQLYFSGQMISMMGSWMQSTVMAWLVYRMSHSATWLGIISFCTQMPAFLASPIAGVVADKQDRKRLLIMVNWIGLIQAILLSLLVLTQTIQLWHIATLSVLLGLSNAFDITARHSFAFDLVGSEDLHSAIACNSLNINGSRIIGPMLAGTLIGVLGEAGCFTLNALSYLAILISLWLIQLPPKPTYSYREIFSSQPLHEIKRAVQYIRNTPTILRLILLSAFISFFGFPFQVLLPVFAKVQLQGDVKTLAWLSGAAGGGAILGAFRVGRTHEVSADQTEKEILSQLLIIGIFLILLGASNHLFLSCLACLGVGYFLIGIFPSLNTSIQKRVDPPFRGRVISLYTMSFLGAMPLGSFLAGWLADHLQASRIEMAFGGIFIIASLFLNRKTWKPLLFFERF